MRGLIYRAGAGAASAALLLASSAPALAADATIEGNGARSNNTIVISSSCSSHVSQRNSADVGVTLLQSANTGGNTANANTGGDVSIDTGNATAEATVTVRGSTNTADIPDCCECESSGSATISENGFRSTNTIVKRDRKRTSVRQRNRTRVGVIAAQKPRTGRNRANRNTGGIVSILTGSADVFFDITVGSSSND